MALLDELKEYFALKGEFLNRNEIIQLIGESLGIIPQKAIPGSNFGAPDSSKVYFAEVGQYNLNGTIVTTTANLTIFVWDKISWSTLPIDLSLPISDQISSATSVYSSIKVDSIAALKINKAEKGVSLGVASLDQKGKVFRNQLDLSDRIPMTQRGTAYGVATLGADGKIVNSQLNLSGINYMGIWDPNTNTPILINGVGNKGDWYAINLSGIHDFGNGEILFLPNDKVIYSGAIWQQNKAQDFEKPTPSDKSFIFL